MLRYLAPPARRVAPGNWFAAAVAGWVWLNFPVWLSFPVGPALGGETPRAEFFEKKIRPVLVEHCYACHSAEAEAAGKLKGELRLDTREAARVGGPSGPAVVPDKPAESLLLSALRYEDFQMPPSGRLPDQVVADFTTWIREGAHDPREDSAPPPAARRGQLDLAQARQHWAYRPLEPPRLPQVIDRHWASSPVDLFVLAGLEAEHWRPAPPASREVLIRRLSYDLIGLPPTPEEVDQFLADHRPDAYQRLVDRLLSSPRFGERWGRHWLDVARFGESNTLRGTVFSQAWRYRDWVIAAFNQDLPYDRFMQLQVAGDLLPADDWRQHRRQLTATTLLTLGNTNFENQDKQQLRMDVVDEQLETVCRAFLAQTIGCARCHDHKFDPIPTRDYYALAGILRNTKTLEHANVSRWLEAPLPASPEREARYQEHARRVAELREQVNSLRQQLGGKAQAGTGQPKSVPRTQLAGIVLDNLTAELQGTWVESTHSPRFVDAGYLHDEHAGLGEKSATFAFEVAEGQYDVRISYSPGANRASNALVRIEHAEGEAKVRVNQRQTPPLDGLLLSLGQFRFGPQRPARVEIRNDGADGHVIVDAVQLLPVAGIDRPATPGALAGHQAGNGKAERQAMAQRLETLQRQLKQLEAAAPPREMVMTVLEEEQIESTRIHIRGNVHNLGGEAPRGFLQVVDYGPPATFDERESGRRQLGQWLADEHNPLPARVMANRLWHWLFGAGLVRTTDNFGTVGERPSHPELLEYLALRLHRSGWSTKSLIRELVLSETYRMSSDPVAPLAAGPDASPAQRDPDNRLLWRARRQRLEAECLRDAVLRASGQLDLRMGGPTFPEGRKEDYDFHYDGTRRSVYVPVFRNSLPELFEVFDFADPSMVVGRRATSTVAPQALFLMNNPWVIRHSQRAAQRLFDEYPGTDAGAQAARLDRAFRLVLGRSPSADERQLATEFLGAACGDAKFGDTKSGSEPGKPSSQRLAAWSQLVQSLVASIDFRYAD